MHTQIGEMSSLMGRQLNLAKQITALFTRLANHPYVSQTHPLHKFNEYSNPINTYLEKEFLLMHSKSPQALKSEVLHLNEMIVFGCAPALEAVLYITEAPDAEINHTGEKMAILISNINRQTRDYSDKKLKELVVNNVLFIKDLVRVITNSMPDEQEMEKNTLFDSTYQLAGTAFLDYVYSNPSFEELVEELLSLIMIGVQYVEHLMEVFAEIVSEIMMNSNAFEVFMKS